MKPDGELGTVGAGECGELVVDGLECSSAVLSFLTPGRFEARELRHLQVRLHRSSLSNLTITMPQHIKVVSHPPSHIRSMSPSTEEDHAVPSAHPPCVIGRRSGAVRKAPNNRKTSNYSALPLSIAAIYWPCQ